MVTFKSIAEQWAREYERAKDALQKTRVQQISVLETRVTTQDLLSDIDANSLARAINILNAHDAFLDVLSAEENNRMALEPRDYRVEFTTFYLQRKAINKHRGR